MQSRASAIQLPRLSSELMFLLRALLFFIVVVNSRILFSRTSNIPYAREIYTGLLCLYFVVFVGTEVIYTLKLPAAGCFVLGLIATLMTVSSVAAMVTYGQPLQYGVFEQRHALGYLIFFPIYQGLRQGIIDRKQLFRWICIAAVICFVVGSVLYVHRAGNISGAQEFASESEARRDRVQIGTWYMVLSTFYGLIMWRRNPKENRWAILALLGVVYVMLFEQSRQSMLVVGLVSAWLLRKRLRLVAKLGLFVVALLTPIAFYFSDVLPTYIAKYQLLLELSAAPTENLRATTLGLIFQRSLWLPHGALSMHWRQGFWRVMGDHFWLVDVGIFGTVFAYGLLVAVPLVLVYYGYFAHQYRRAEKSPEILACGAFLCAMVMINVFQPVLETAGFEMGMVLAVLACARKDAQEAVASSEQERGR